MHATTREISATMSSPVVSTLLTCVVLFASSVASSAPVITS